MDSLTESVVHPDQLYAALHRRPFVPFRVHVSDGSAYDVRHADAIWMTRRAAYLALPGDPGQIPERAVVVALIHVSRLEELTTAPPSGNGAE